jgi:hypothetical protein
LFCTLSRWSIDRPVVQIRVRLRQVALFRLSFWRSPGRRSSEPLRERTVGDKRWLSALFPP